MTWKEKKRMERKQKGRNTQTDCFFLREKEEREGVRSERVRERGRERDKAREREREEVNMRLHDLFISLLLVNIIIK